MGKSGPEPYIGPYKIGGGRVGGLTKKTAYSPCFGVVLLICIFLPACGIEDYPYLYPVPQGNISQELNSRAMIRINVTDNSSSSSPFYNYAIYYRIYVGDYNESSPSAGNFSNINTTLAQDYSAIAAYINSTTMGNTSMGSLFQNRNYNVLEMEDPSRPGVALALDSLLASEPLTVVIEFSQSQGQLPYLTINGSLLRYNLYRSTGNGRFTPMPENSRYFMNYPELTNPDYINANNNADVVNKSEISGGIRHAYAAFFIVAVGLDTNTFSSIYSTPAFVGVLRLPDP
jgi:hypothetical protein